MKYLISLIFVSVVAFGTVVAYGDTRMFCPPSPKNFSFTGAHYWPKTPDNNNSTVTCFYTNGDKKYLKTFYGPSYYAKKIAPWALLFPGSTLDVLRCWEGQQTLCHFFKK